ncbi:MAG: TlpA family protein disulfide reductase [Lachnotalea sp.]
MKKHSLLIMAILLFGIALYTVNTYDKKTEVNSASDNLDDNDQSQSDLKPSASLNASDKTGSSIIADSNQGSDRTYEKAQDFQLVDLQGNKVSLSDYKGKKVFLNFWATWCPPCKAEMPEIEKIYQETKDSDLVILAVEIGEPQEDVKTFVDNNNYNFKVLLDFDQSVATSYGISSIPTSFFIDEAGNIIAKRVGGMNYDEMKEYKALLEK